MLGTRWKARDIWNEVVSELEGNSSTRIYNRKPEQLPDREGRALDNILGAYTEDEYRHAVKAMLVDPFWNKKTDISLVTPAQGENMERFLSRGIPAPAAARPYSQFRAAE